VSDLSCLESTNSHNTTQGGTYERLMYPQPTPLHENYPFFTPGGQDKRWLGSGPLEENGRLWVGAMMYVVYKYYTSLLKPINCRITAQIVGPRTREHFTEGSPFQDLDLMNGPGRSQFASFTWADLDAIAPWLDEYITKRVDGPGLGN
jgi:hypothetical protein